jgi:hypothetical protein
VKKAGKEAMLAQRRDARRAKSVNRLEAFKPDPAPVKADRKPLPRRSRGGLTNVY